MFSSELEKLEEEALALEALIMQAASRLMSDSCVRALNKALDSTRDQIRDLRKEKEVNENLYNFLP